MKRAEVSEIVEILIKEYPDSTPALKYTTPFELLVAVILSAQCTDERVNLVTAKLFERYSTPQQMVTLSQKELERYIFSCGFYHNKALHIISSAKDIMQKYGGEVPSSLEELQTLAGVGRKTANVVYSVAFGGDAIAVDTHVFRVSNRIGLANAKTPLDTEKQLMARLPKEKWSHMHHAIIFHGRRVCSARNPKCEACVVSSLCRYNNSKKRG